MPKYPVAPGWRACGWNGPYVYDHPDGSYAIVRQCIMPRGRWRHPMDRHGWRLVRRGLELPQLGFHTRSEAFEAHRQWLLEQRWEDDGGQDEH